MNGPLEKSCNWSLHVLFFISAEDSERLGEESQSQKSRKCSFKREYGKLKTMVPALGEREDLTKVSQQLLNWKVPTYKPTMCLLYFYKTRYKEIWY